MPMFLIVFTVGALLVIGFIEGWEAGHPEPRNPRSSSPPTKRP